MSEETAAWIEDRRLDWEKAHGRTSLKKFADWLGVSVNSLNNWISRKQTPQGDSVRILADKLGPEIYSLIGVTPPDPRLEAIVRNWGALSEEEKDELYAEAERMAALGAEEPAVAAPKRRSKN